MAAPERPDEDVVAQILEILRDDQSTPPEDLDQRTVTKVRATVTMRDLVDLTTLVFVLHFCAPIIDLIAAMFGTEIQRNDRRNPDE